MARRAGSKRRTARYHRRGSGARSRGHPKKMVEFAGYHTCPACQHTKQWLRQNHVKFKFHPVDSKKGAQLADTIHAQSVPVIKACDVSHGKASNCKFTEGFNEPWLKRVLKL